MIHLQPQSSVIFFFFCMEVTMSAVGADIFVSHSENMCVSCKAV